MAHLWPAAGSRRGRPAVDGGPMGGVELHGMQYEPEKQS